MPLHVVLDQPSHLLIKPSKQNRSHQDSDVVPQGTEEACDLQCHIRGTYHTHLAGSSFGLEDVIRGQSQLATLASQSSRPTAYCDDDSLRGDGLVLTLVPRTEVQRDAVRVHETAQSVNVGHFLGFKVRLLVGV